ncbi:hypothetical protein TNCV_3983181 [Trichonephila clavipes]|nr:hypothetical protein TNCV_3983181 [Trichonephila clavipes]
MLYLNFLRPVYVTKTKEDLAQWSNGEYQDPPQTQVLGPKPKYVLYVSQALDLLRQAGVAGVYVTPLTWLHYLGPLLTSKSALSFSILGCVGLNSIL